MRQDLIRHMELKKEIDINDGELNLAKKIQKMFVSESLDFGLLQHNNCDVASHFKSAEYLSGDVFDVINKGGVSYLLIADSIGKNTSACIFSLFVLSEFRSLVSAHDDLEKIIHDLNNYIYARNNLNMFISCVIVKVDFDNNTIEIVNAGHDMPIIVSRENDLINTTEGNIVLGVIKDSKYDKDVISITDCQSITLYTDGIPETHSKDGLYGTEKIVEQLMNTNKSTAKELIENIVSGINDFKDKDMKQDDESILIVCFGENNYE
jgi:sigma-B regulation protein RsbU (phosphoserine phosphatase)